MHCLVRRNIIWKQYSVTHFFLFSSLSRSLGYCVGWQILWNGYHQWKEVMGSRGGSGWGGWGERVSSWCNACQCQIVMLAQKRVVGLWMLAGVCISPLVWAKLIEDRSVWMYTTPQQTSLGDWLCSNHLASASAEHPFLCMWPDWLAKDWGGGRFFSYIPSVCCI